MGVGWEKKALNFLELSCYLSSPTYQRFLVVFPIQTTPVDFFGVPVNDETLLEARADEVLAIGKEFVVSTTYNSHLRRLSSESDEEVMQSFYVAVAGLTSEHQDEFFQALVAKLEYKHVTDRLEEGKVLMLC